MICLNALCLTPLPTAPPPPPPPPPPTSHPSPTHRVYIPTHIYTHPAAILLELCASKREIYQTIPVVYKHGLSDEHLFQTKLVSLFCKLGSLDDATRVFNPIEDKIEPLYHTMLKGYAENGRLDDALLFFSRMIEDGIDPVVYDFTYLLKLCGESSEIRWGKAVHGQSVVHGFGSDLFAMTSAMNMYAKCRKVRDAYRMFDRMPRRDVVSWNAMIAGFAQNGYAQMVLELVARMQMEGIRPNSVTVVTVLPALAGVRFLRTGKSIHGFVMWSGLDLFVNVSTALVDPYSKCGAVAAARLVF